MYTFVACIMVVQGADYNYDTSGRTVTLTARMVRLSIIAPASSFISETWALSRRDRYGLSSNVGKSSQDGRI